MEWKIETVEIKTRKEPTMSVNDAISELVNIAVEAALEDVNVKTSQVDGLESLVDEIVAKRVEDALNEFSVSTDNIEGFDDAVTESVNSDLNDRTFSVSDIQGLDDEIKDAVDNAVSNMDAVEASEISGLDDAIAEGVASVLANTEIEAHTIAGLDTLIETHMDKIIQTPVFQTLLVGLVNAAVERALAAVPTANPV